MLFCSSTFHIVINTLFLLTSIAYVCLGSFPDVRKYLVWLKALPTILLIIKLIPVRFRFMCVFYILIGLFFGMLGDILLQYSQKVIFAILGMLSFLIGHIFYILSYNSAVRRIQIKKKLNEYIFFIFFYSLLVVALAIINLSGIYKYMKTSQKIGFTIYAVVLCTMNILGYVLMTQSRNDHQQMKIPSILIYLGSLLFLCSDMVLSQRIKNQSISPQAKSTLRYIVLITYYLGQFLICQGALQIAKFYRNDYKKTINRTMATLLMRANHMRNQIMN